MWTLPGGHGAPYQTCMPMQRRRGPHYKLRPVASHPPWATPGTAGAACRAIFIIQLGAWANRQHASGKSRTGNVCEFSIEPGRRWTWRTKKAFCSHPDHSGTAFISCCAGATFGCPVHPLPSSFRARYVCGGGAAGRVPSVSPAAAGPHAKATATSCRPNHVPGWCGLPGGQRRDSRSSALRSRRRRGSTRIRGGSRAAGGGRCACRRMCRPHSRVLQAEGLCSRSTA